RRRCCRTLRVVRPCAVHRDPGRDDRTGAPQYAGPVYGRPVPGPPGRAASLSQAYAPWLTTPYVSLECVGLEHDWMPVSCTVRLTAEQAADLGRLLADSGRHCRGRRGAAGPARPGGRRLPAVGRHASVAAGVGYRALAGPGLRRHGGGRDTVVARP